MEDLALLSYTKELIYYIELSKIDALWMQYGIAWWDYGWLYDPWQTAADMIPLIVGSSHEPDYESKVNQWVVSLIAKMDRWKAMGERAVANKKTHADVNMRFQYDLGFGPVGYYYAFTANYSPLCDSMGATAKATCMRNTDTLMGKLVDFLSWWNNVYRPACESNRPDSAPGLWNVPQGDKIYDILQIYHLGAVQNDTELNELGNAGVNEILAQFEDLRTKFDGAPIDTVSDLIAAMGDTNDARFNLCTQDPNVAKQMTSYNMQEIEKRLYPYFGFQSRSFLEITITGSGLTFSQPGSYDRKKKFWTGNTLYNIGVVGTCGIPDQTPPFLSYGLVDARSDAALVGKPGITTQATLQTEIDCNFGQYVGANTMFQAGWALHASHLGLELGIYDSPLHLLGYYKGRGLRDNRLREDTCLHSSDPTMPEGQRHCTFEEAVQMMMELGYNRENAVFEAERYVITGGQALAYRLGDIYLQKLRKETADEITKAGFVFDPREFYNVILRFGGGDLIQSLTPLMKTYVKYATGKTILPSDFGSDMIPSKLYSTGNPEIGAGRDATCQ